MRMSEGINVSSLLPYSKIASLSKGRATVHSENLGMILRSVNHLQKNTPEAIAAVLGPKLTGTYFFSNCMTQYVRKGGTDGWVHEIISRVKLWKPMMEKGDNSWGYPRSVKFTEDNESDGIYLYPQSLLVNKREGQVLLWIMHAEVNQIINESVAIKFLALACSMLLEVTWKEDSKKDPQLLVLYRETFQNPRFTICESDLCKITTILERAPEKSTSTKPHESGDAAASCSSDPKVEKEADTVSIISNITKIVAKFLDKKKLVAKTTSKGVLTFEYVEEFIKMLSRKANDWEEMFKVSYAAQMVKTKADLEALVSLKQVLEKEYASNVVLPKDDLPTEMKCPICDEVYRRKVLLCLNGHALCDRCFRRVAKCPECRVRLRNPRIRCKPLEELMRRWKLSCPYWESGCRTELAAREFNDHVETCEWRFGLEQKLRLDSVKAQITEKEAELRQFEITTGNDVDQNFQEMMGNVSLATSERRDTSSGNSSLM